MPQTGWLIKGGRVKTGSWEPLVITVKNSLRGVQGRQETHSTALRWEWEEERGKSSVDCFLRGWVCEGKETVGSSHKGWES